MFEDQFTHDGKLYDLTKVRISLRPNKTFFLKISELLWVLKYDKPDENRVLHAKLRYPLIVARDKKGRWTVVDGLHRLERYRRRGFTIVPVKEATDAILEEAYIGPEHK